MAVTVVGAGLAGSLAALYLARDGHRVEVFERRPDPRLDSGHGRSINLGVSARGLAALREVGLDDALLARSVVMRGRVVHQGGTTRFQPYGTAADEVLHSVLRRDLNALLIDAAQALPGVSFRFDTRLTTLDADEGVCWFTDEHGAEQAVKADLVIGADGAFSVVREHLVRGTRVDYRQEFLDWGYKELTIPPGPDGTPRAELEALHVWPGEHGLMVGHPNLDGSHTCTLFLPYEGPHSFAALDSPAAVRRFFDEHFPDAAALMPDLQSEFAVNPVGGMVSVGTSAWHHGDRVVLVGDACHAVYPFYGQGMNAAFEDCSVLMACLRDRPTDRAAALADYQSRRRPHTDVLADLARLNFVELRDGLRSPLFVARKRADLALNRLLGERWRPLYTMVSHTTMPYADALHRARRQDRALAWAGAGALLGLGAAVRLVRTRRGGR